LQSGFYCGKANNTISKNNEFQRRKILSVRKELEKALKKGINNVTFL